MRTPAAIVSGYRRAISLIEALEVDIDQTATNISEIRRDRDLSAEAKVNQTAKLRAELIERARANRATVTELLATAAAAADTVLAGDPGDNDLEIRKARAVSRVSRLLDAGRTLTEVAAVFSEAEDLVALRALRDEIPALVAAQPDMSGPDARPQRAATIARLTVHVDERMRPLLPAPEAALVGVRINAEPARRWVEAAAVLAVKVSQGPGQRGALSDIRRMPASV